MIMTRFIALLAGYFLCISRQDVVKLVSVASSYLNCDTELVNPRGPKTVLEKKNRLIGNVTACIKNHDGSCRQLL